MDEVVAALIQKALEAQDASDYLALESRSSELVDYSTRTQQHDGLAWGYYYLGSAYFQRNDGGGAERVLRRSLELFQELGDDYGRARTMLSFGAVALDVYQDFDQARHWYDRAIPLIRKSGDRARLAVALGNLGEICRSEGHLSAALRYAHESLQLFREREAHTNAGWQLADIGHYHAIRREFSDSIAALREAYDELAHERNPRWIAWLFDIWFIVAAMLERFEDAAALLGFVDRYRHEYLTPRMQGLFPWFSGPVEELGKRTARDQRLDEVRISGEAMSLEEAHALTEQIASALI